MKIKKWVSQLLPFVLFLLMQLILIDSVPKLAMDESLFGAMASQIYGGKPPHVGWGYMPYLFMYVFFVKAVFTLFGIGLFQMRLLSVLIGIVTLFGIRKIFKLYELPEKYFWGVSLFLTFSNVFFILFRWGRPEGLVACFTVWAFYYLFLAFKKGLGKHYLLSGCFIGFGALTHPVGSFGVLFFSLVILFESYQKRRFMPVLYFLYGGLVVGSIFILHLHVVSKETVPVFINTILNQSMYKGSQGASIFQSAFHNFIHLAQSYCLGIKRVYIFIFELGILLAGLVIPNRKEVKSLSLFGLFYILYVGFTTGVYFRRYFFIPVMMSCLIYFFVFFEFSKIQSKKKLSILIILGMIYLGNNIAGDMYIMLKQHNQTSYQAISKQLKRQIPSHSTVLTLLEFWFPFSEHTCYTPSTNLSKLNYESFSDMLATVRFDYVVVSDYLTKRVSPTTGQKAKYFGSLNETDQMYQAMHNHAKANGSKIDEISTIGYSDIEVWKMNYD